MEILSCLDYRKTKVFFFFCYNYIFFPLNTLVVINIKILFLCCPGLIFAFKTTVIDMHHKNKVTFKRSDNCRVRLMWKRKLHCYSPITDPHLRHCRLQQIINQFVPPATFLHFIFSLLFTDLYVFFNFSLFSLFFCSFSLLHISYWPFYDNKDDRYFCYAQVC